MVCAFLLLLERARPRVLFNSEHSPPVARSSVVGGKGFGRSKVPKYSENIATSDQSKSLAIMAVIGGPGGTPSMGRVLIVEDDCLIALEISQFVEGAGYTVVGPETSVDATIRTLARHKIDLALLDVKLGGELVFPIAKHLDDKGIPYIFLTSYSAAAIPAQHRHRPLVSKPYSPERLLAQMQQFLG
jgi:CheY-like chemotaxis protein